MNSTFLTDRPRIGRRSCRSRRFGSPRREGSASHANRLGASIVEFAIIANVLLVIIFACIEFARLSLIRNLAQDAAYFAARIAMVPGGTSAEAIAEANRILGIINTQNAAVTINNGQGLSDSSSEVRVRIQVPVDDNALFVPMFSRGRTIETEAVMRTERYDGFFQASQ